LTDDDDDYRPDKYAVNRWGFELNMKIPIVKITDYTNKTDELEKSNNPMAIVVLTVLDSFKAKDDGAKFNIKMNLIRKLYKKCFDKDRITSVFKFIDWILNLPDQYELKVRDEIDKLEGNTMSYVTSIERIAIKETKIQTAINMLKDGLSIDKIIKYTGLAKTELEKLIKKNEDN